MIQTLRFRTLTSFVVLTLLLSGAPSMLAQSRVPPRDQEKLISRVEQFWASVIHGRRAEAMQLVTRERQDDFLSGDPLPVIEAKVVGFDLTDSRERAAIRVTIKALVPLTGLTTVWTLTDSWVWRGNNWYANPAPKADFWSAMNGNVQNTEEVVKITKEIETQLQGMPAEIDLGRVTKGVQHTFAIPVQYSGPRPLRVSLIPPNPVFLVDREFKEGGKALRAYVDAESLDGQFAIPVKVRFSFATSDVDKTVLIKGNVFRPITFRHTPSGPLRKGAILTVFVKNNTSEALLIEHVGGDIDAGEQRVPASIGPGEEGELVFTIISDSPPTRVDLMFKKAVFGSAQYSYIFPKTP
jgi:hypothetical protein